MFRSFFSWQRYRKHSPRKGVVGQPRRFAFRPRVELLEVRMVPSFAAGLDFPTAGGQYSIVLADINKDNKADMVWAGNDTGYYALGNGDGSFKAPVALALPSDSHLGLVVADFNKDGNPDIAATNYYGASVSILQGNGNGTFKNPVNKNTIVGDQELTAADLTNDNYVDLVVGTINQTKISVLVNNGDGTFKAAVNPSTDTSPVAVAVGDFNKDGNPDVITANYGATDFSFLAGNGNGTFKPAVNLTASNQGAVDLEVAYLNADGNLDLIAADANTNAVSIYLGNGNGTFTAPANVTIEAAPNGAVFPLTVGDVNGDGKADFVVTNTNSPDVTVALGNGDGTFKTPVNYLAGYSPGAIALGDVNSDNKTDLAVAHNGNNDLTVLLGNGNGSFVSAACTSLTSSNSILAAGDLNGDGKEDLVSAWSTNLQVLLGNGDGTFQAPLNTILPASTPTAIQVADFNGDGKLDVVVANGSGVDVLLGQGDGTFRPGSVFYANGANPDAFSVVVADLNADGKPDLAVGTQSGQSVNVLYGNGDGTFQSAVSISTGLFGPYQLAIGDFNSDGKPDLVAADWSSTGFQVLLNNGDGTFATVNNTAISFFWSEAVADLTGDGKVDLVAYDYATNLISFYQGNGDGTFQAPINYTLESGSGNYPQVTLVDMDGDGKLDVVAPNYNTGSVSVLLGNGNGTFKNAVNYSANGYGTNGMAIADFDGNHAPDIAVSSGYYSSLVLIQNRAPATHFAVSAPASTPTGGTVSVTASALNAFNGVDPYYRGTVHLTSSDGAAGLPGDYPFTAADKGVHTFSVTLNTAGVQTVTATDKVTGSITGSASVIVDPATHFGISLPASATAGSAYSVTVTALDAANATVPYYTGTVHFTSSDPNLTIALPADYTFLAGDHGVKTFTNAVTLKTAGSQSVTATDTANASVTGSGSVPVSAAAAAVMTVSGPSTATAGTAGTYTVTLRDIYGNIATGYLGMVHVSTSDVQANFPADYQFTGGDAGVHTFTNGVTFKTAGSQSLNVADTNNGALNANEAVSVSAAALSTLAVSGFPTPVTAGTVSTFTVKAVDAFGNLIAGYTGKVHFTSTDAQATLPPDYTFTAGDAGQHAFSGVLRTAGNQTLTATDAANSSVTGGQPVTVNPAAASQFSLAAPATTAGQSFSLVVTVLDRFGNIATGYLGTVHFTSGDPTATLPANYKFVAGDAGVHTFTGVVLRKAGGIPVTATDTINSSVNGTAVVSVGPGAAAVVAVTGMANPVAAGTPTTVTVTMLDAFFNVATGYLGTIHFSGTDAKEALPADYPFVVGDAGSHTFVNKVTLKTAGTQTVTATDSSNPALNGSSSVTVTPLAATQLVVTLSAKTVTAGTAMDVTVTAEDKYGNVAPTYSGMVHFTSTDAQGILPADYQFVAADKGVHTITGGVTLKSAGTQTVTATDTATSTITGKKSVTVKFAAVDHFAIAAPASVTAGTAFSVMVTAQDLYGNTVTNYAGKAHFSSSDGQAVLPVDHKYTTGDAGKHIFNVTLKTTGTQSLTVTDLLNASILGTVNIQVN